MAFVILLGAFGFLIAAIVVAVRTAAQVRQERDDFGEAFDEARGYAVDPDDETPSWSSFDLAVLADDAVTVDGGDPYATLTSPNPAVTWHEEPDGNGPAPAEPALIDDAQPPSWHEQPDGNGSAPVAPAVIDDAPPLSWHEQPDGNGSAPVAPAVIDDAPPLSWHEQPDGNGLAPALIDDAQPITWRPPAEAPVIILVVGVGFLGAGGAAVSAAAAMRLERDRLHGAYVRPRGNGHDYEAGPSPWSSFDPAILRHAVVVDGQDAFEQLTHTSSPISRHDPPSGNRSEPDRIAWRAPVDVAHREFRTATQ